MSAARAAGGHSLDSARQVALTVRDIMDADPVTVGPDDDVEELVRRLRYHELPGVPVVNEGGRCIGIVTEADFVIADE